MQGDGMQGDGMQGDGMQGDGMQGDGMQGDGMQGDDILSCKCNKSYTRNKEHLRDRKRIFAFKSSKQG
jgi:hypothetical protein